MATGLWQLSLCVAMVIQLTSSQPTYDVTQPDNDVSSCGSNGGSEQMLDHLTRAVSQLTAVVWQVQTTVSQLQHEITKLKTDVCQRLNETCWTRSILQNINASSSFNRSWAEYKVGFSDGHGNYWLGNDILHELTVNGNYRYKLRIEVQSASSSQWYWAEYTTFTVLGENTNYRLLIGGFTGNTGFDAMAKVNGSMFSTHDRDNDLSSSSCVKTWKAGGFWYNGLSGHCYDTSLTSLDSSAHFVWRSLPGGLRIKAAQMLLVCYL